MKQPNMAELVSAWQKAKAAESAANDERGTVADYINDHASERIRLLVAGLLGNEAALERAKREAQQLRADAIGYAAWLMDDDRIERAL